MKTDFSQITKSFRLNTPTVIGRRPQLEYIHNHLDYGKHAAILIRGDFGIGKSTLISIVKEGLSIGELGGDRHFGWFPIESNSISNCAEFAKNIWDGMLITARKKHGVDLPTGLESPFIFDTNPRFLFQLDLFWTFFPEDSFVVFVDDFDNIFRYFLSSEYRRVIGLMNEIIFLDSSNNGKGKITFLLAMNQKLPYFAGSALAAEDIPLGPLDEGSFKASLSSLIGESCTIPVNWLNKTFEHTGGYPLFGWLFLEHLLNHLALERWEKFPSEKDMPDIVKDVIISLKENQKLDDWFSSLREDEQEILLLMADNDGVLPKTTFLTGKKYSVCEELKIRKYIFEDQDRYKINIPFIYDWMNNWVRFPEKLEQFSIPRRNKWENRNYPSNMPAVGICFDAGAKRVYVDGIDVDEKKLIRTVYDAILCLCRKAVQYPGQIVTKQELASAIRHEVYYEGDDSLVTTTIYRCRLALGPIGSGYLKTRSKQGYHLDCEVVLLNDLSDDSTNKGH